MHRMQIGDFLRGTGYTITLTYDYSELQQKAPDKKSAQSRGSTFSLRTSCRRSIISSCSCSSSSLPLQLRESKVCKAEGQTTSHTAHALPKAWGYMAGIMFFCTQNNDESKLLWKGVSIFMQQIKRHIKEFNCRGFFSSHRISLSDP